MSDRPAGRTAAAWLALLLLATPPARAEDPAPTAEGARAAARAGRHEEARDAWRRLLDDARARGERDAAALAPLERGLADALLALGEHYAALEPLGRAAKGGEAADRRRYAAALLEQARRNADEGGATAGQVVPYLDDALRALEGLDDAEAGRLAGEAHYQAGRLSQAIEAWRRVPRAAPPDARDLWYAERLAHALYLAGRYDESAREYEALGHRRGAAAAWTAAKDGERALGHLLDLLEESPGDPVLLEEAMTTARLTALERRLERALAALPATGPAARASHARVRARLLVLLAEHGAAAELLRATRDALGGGAAAEMGAALARTLLLTPGLDETGRDEAAEALLVAAAAAPDAAEVAALMTTMAQQDFAAAPGAWPDARPLERGVALLTALAKASPDDPLVLANLGNMLRLAGRAPEAVAALEAACRAAPGDAAVTNDLGLALLAAGDRVAARAAFERAVAEDAGLAAARQNLARLLAERGDAAAARAHLSAAEAASRRAGQPFMLYRFLALRIWRIGAGGR